MTNTQDICPLLKQAKRLLGVSDGSFYMSNEYQDMSRYLIKCYFGGCLVSVQVFLNGTNILISRMSKATLPPNAGGPYGIL